jgi:hypothetical protein
MTRPSSQGKEEPMASLPTPIPACAPDVHTFLPLSPARSPLNTSEASNEFALLVRLVQDNEKLFAAREALLARLQSARLYAADPHSNPNLAKANLQHLKVKYSGILALLRANRREAQALLARLEPDRGARGKLVSSGTDPRLWPIPEC